MAYSEKVLNHYDNPCNVGSLDKNDKNVGTGLVGAPACGDVMKLQIKVKKIECESEDEDSDSENMIKLKSIDENGNLITKEVKRVTRFKHIIEDVKFKTFGCGSAIAASSLATKKIKCQTLDYAETIRDRDLAEELELPPVKIHCSVLAEEAIKAAIKDYMDKQKELEEQDEINSTVHEYIKNQQPETT